MGNSISYFFEPIGDYFLSNRLFDDSPEVNMDGRLQPFIHLKNALTKLGINVNTIDKYCPENMSSINYYFSLGGMKYWPQLVGDTNIKLEYFFIFDCPIAYPAPYRNLDKLLSNFKKVYTYSSFREMTKFSQRASELHRFCWPLPYDKVSAPHWGNRNRKFMTTIISNKRPACPGPELYSERINAVKYFAQSDKIDLYGIGWNKTFPTHPFHFKWYFNSQFRKAWRGAVASKYDTLAGYTFAICFENMIMDGWITEKIFDCFYTGTIPIYLGASDITDTIPKDTFIDFRDFGSYDDLSNYLDSLPAGEIDGFRERARRYMGSIDLSPHSMETFSGLFLDINRTDRKPLP